MVGAVVHPDFGSRNEKAGSEPPAMNLFSYFIVGMENSAPSLMPDGQRDVTVLVLV
jgi:hypothetical protein